MAEPQPQLRHARRREVVGAQVDGGKRGRSERERRSERLRALVSQVVPARRELLERARGLEHLAEEAGARAREEVLVDVERLEVCAPHQRLAQRQSPLVAKLVPAQVQLLQAWEARQRACDQRHALVLERVLRERERRDGGRLRERARQLQRARARDLVPAQVELGQARPGRERGRDGLRAEVPDVVAVDVERLQFCAGGKAAAQRGCAPRADLVASERQGREKLEVREEACKLLCVMRFEICLGNVELLDFAAPLVSIESLEEGVCQGGVPCQGQRDNCRRVSEVLYCLDYSRPSSLCARSDPECD
mmetsp:Transcript_5499/g.13296  ORF Transcript_5499/g.13296 Transcript_5499/m.13296 type:complete len:307 (-) Transcript_5499:559-1479(-)